MRLGPFEFSRVRRSALSLGERVSMAALAPPPNAGVRRPRPNATELGSSGKSVYGMLLGQEDYNVDLQSPQVYDTYDRMRKGDGQVASALRVVKLPLLSADWHIEPASENAIDIQIAEYLDQQLMNMTISWSNLLRQALLMLDYGSYPFEKVWELLDNHINLRKLAPRHPRTVGEWQLDANGGIRGIQQRVMRDGMYHEVQIPIDKLLIFVNDQEGSDYRGNSLLRAAYKHWYFKDKMYIIDAIAKERRAIGVDVGTLKGDATEGDQRDLESALMTLHAHEKQFMVEQEDAWTYRVEGTQGTVVSALESIEHHDVRILRSVLAEFLSMGEGSSGSLAMHKDKSSFFIMALQSVGRNICDTFDRHLIPQWVNYNWPNVTEYPKLVHSRLDTRPISEIADAISKFINAGALSVNYDLETEVRTILGLPEIDEEEYDELHEPVATSPMPGEEVDEDGNPIEIEDDNPFAGKRKQKRKRPGTIYRPRRGAVRRNVPRLGSRYRFAQTVDFNNMANVLDEGESDIVSAIKSQQVRQIEKLVEVAFKALQRGDVSKIHDIFVPFQGDLAESLAATLESVYETGARNVSKELGLPQDFGLELTPKRVVEFLKLRARSVAALMGDRLKRAVVWETLEQHAKNDISESKLRNSLTQLSDREMRKVAGNTVSEALNLGRDTLAKASGKPLMATFSSKLDNHTCSDCSHADGTVVEVGSQEYMRLRPPYKECDGRGRCRCIFVYEESD